MIFTLGQMKSSVKQVIRIKIIILCIATMVSAIWSQSAAVTVSVFLGGLTGILPALLYAKIAYQKRHVAPNILMRAHYRAEAAKFGATVLMFAVIIGLFTDLSVVAYFGGYIACLSAYWLGLLNKN